MSEATTSQAPSMDNDKVMAAVATIPLVGLIMYFAMKDASDLVKFYAKQSIGLLVVSIAISIISFILAFVPFLNLITSCLSLILALALMGIWLVLLINALQGNKYRLPVLADLVDQYIK